MNFEPSDFPSNSINNQNQDTFVDTSKPTPLKPIVLTFSIMIGVVVLFVLCFSWELALIIGGIMIGFFGLILALVEISNKKLISKQQDTQYGMYSSNSNRTCPYCGKPLKGKVSTCPHCKNSI